jgi:hypothetical protein
MEALGTCSNFTFILLPRDHLQDLGKCAWKIGQYFDNLIVSIPTIRSDLFFRPFVANALSMRFPFRS